MTKILRVARSGNSASVPSRKRHFYLPHNYQTGSGDPASSPVIGNWGSFLGLRRPRFEADNTSNAKIKNAWNYGSTPFYTFIVKFLIGHRVNFASFTLLIHSSSFFKDIHMLWGHHECPKIIKFQFTFISFPLRCFSCLLPLFLFSLYFSSFLLDKLATSPLFPWSIKDRSDLSSVFLVWRDNWVVR